MFASFDAHSPKAEVTHMVSGKEIEDISLPDFRSTLKITIF